MDGMAASPKYKRVLLKLSGQVLASDERGYGISFDTISRLAGEFREVVEYSVELAIVVGGGNIFRGASNAQGVERPAADYMGMLATVLNALALQNVLEGLNLDTRVQSAIEMRAVAEPYIHRRAIRHLEKGRIIILAAGTGNPYFSTDTAAALRAAELDAEVILKGTKVDGVYNLNPQETMGAYKYREISYLEMLKKQLKVMDATAVSLCMETNIPIIVFNVTVPGNIKKIILGDETAIGTIVRSGKTHVD